MIETQTSSRGTRATARVALVTCEELGGLDPDDARLVEPLAAAGVAAEPAVWDDAGVDWSAYDLVVLRSAWDYPARRDAFVAWAQAVPRLANPADVVAWNTDKRYLATLADAGVPVVPSSWPAALPASGAVVIKPTVGAGSVDAGRYDLSDPAARRLALAHFDRLHRAGRSPLVQPYLHAVDTVGETALLFVGGRYSHAVRKGAMLDGPAGDVGLYKPEDIAPRTASPAELDVAARALAAVPGGPGRLLYARVDLIPGDDGQPRLVELELTEPSLYLGYGPGAAERFAGAIAARLAAAPPRATR